jgi:hypothetical protein
MKKIHFIKKNNKNEGESNCNDHLKSKTKNSQSTTSFYDNNVINQIDNLDESVTI